MNASLAGVTGELIKLLIRLAALLIEAVTWWLARNAKPNPPQTPEIKP